MACLPVTPNTSPQQLPRLNSQTATNSHDLTPTTQSVKLINNDNTTSHHNNSYKSYFNHISSLCKYGRIREALASLAELESRDFHVGPDIYGELLQGCVYDRALPLGLQIHAQIIKKGEPFTTNGYIETKLVILYAKCGVSDVANRLFRRLRKQDVFSWAAIIGMNSRTCCCEEALLNYIEMQENGLLPDNFVVPNALKACGVLGWVWFGKGIHGYVVKMMGFDLCVFVATSLADMYGKCGVFEDAERVFDGMLEKNIVAWNSMIVVYAPNGMNEEAIRLFLRTRLRLRLEGVEPTRLLCGVSLPHVIIWRLSRMEDKGTLK